jgi:hypothetical protein
LQTACGKRAIFCAAARAIPWPKPAHSWAASFTVRILFRQHKRAMDEELFGQLCRQDRLGCQ